MHRVFQLSLEKQIIHNIKKFIMAFGKDFAFVDNQYHLEVLLDANSSFVTDEIDRSNSSVTTDELQVSDSEVDIIRELQFTNSKDFPFEDFFRVPFTHHSRIIAKVKDIDSRYYYIHRSAEEHMSVERLKRVIEAATRPDGPFDERGISYADGR